MPQNDLLKPVSALPAPSLLSPRPAKPPTPVKPKGQEDDQYRDIGDVIATRNRIYDDVLNAAANLPPVSNAKHTLQLSDLKYVDPEDFSIRDQKKAILANKTLSRRLRGTWTLIDNVTGQPLEKRQATVAHVPYFSPRGTMINNGTEYVLQGQLRMRPGVFTRVKANGELEAHANILPGEGASHRYFLDPEKGVFKIHIGQANIPLMPLLRAMGATDKQLREAWGNELFLANAVKDDTAALNKLYERVLKKREQNPNAGPTDRQKALAAAFQAMKMDPEVNTRTLGNPHANVSLDAMLDITKKLLAVSRGEKEVDDRDHLAFQTFLGPEDLIAERLSRDYGGTRRELLRRASQTASLKNLPVGALTKQLQSVLYKSGLAQALEEINLAEVYDKQSKISRLGEGGISSLDAVPDEARAVQPSHLNFIDPVRTPESAKVGIDSYLAFRVKKGRDGRLYSPFKDVRSGEISYKSAQDIADLTVAFPGQDMSAPRVGVMKDGKIDYAPPSEVDLVVPHFEQAFSPLGAMVPMKSATKAQRMAMASRMFTQALPLREPESPLVQSGVPDQDDTSFEDLFGEKMGALRAKQPGQVTDVTPDGIQVKYANGKTETLELYNNFPFNFKTYYHQTPTVKPGDSFEPGQLLARSNYTDQNGVTAIGKNLRVGYLPFRGYNFEDAIVISESTADKFSSEHAYQHGLTLTDDYKTSKRDFVGMFGGEYSKSLLDRLDDDGVVQEGTVVNYGDPLILAAKRNELAHNKVHKKKQATYANATITWEHHSPGIVTDAVKAGKDYTVLVKTMVPTQEGDKLCYDADTQVLTTDGWLNVAEVTTKHLVASLRADGQLEYLRPVATHKYDHDGRMYRLETTQVDLLVTDNHHLYVQRRRHKEYELRTAAEMYGKRYRLKSDAEWLGRDPEYVELPALKVRAGQAGRGEREIPPLRLLPSTYAMLLGLFLSEGSLFDQPKTGDYGIDITQVKPASRKQIAAALTAAGIRYSDGGEKFRIYGKQLLQHFRQWGDRCYKKRIPAHVFQWSRETLEVLYHWMLRGAVGPPGTGHSYVANSRQLVVDVQRLCLHLGRAAKVEISHEACVQTIKGKQYDCREGYAARIYRSKTRPEINHSHVKRQQGQREAWEHYKGYVYCVTLPRNHVLYVRRNGKPVWCGNSGRYGDKGVISKIVPDHEMPTDAEGRPLEILVNPLGLISRTNSSQIMEAILGKIAAKTGKPYKVKDFEDISDLVEWAKQEAKKHGVRDTETVTDPETGKGIKNILVGNRFFMKLHHMSESKEGGRGTGGYTAEGAPAKGGASGSKRVGLLDGSALLSHGVTSVIRDAAAIRGQRNEDYWLAFMQGVTPPKPKVPQVYEKFVNQLKASGINVVENGTQVNIMALTDKDVDELAGNRYVENGKTVDFVKGLEPVKGGLFDEKLTGGHNATRWSAIKLHEPMPSPAFEEPIRRLLGLTQNKFLDVISGQQQLGEYGTGPSAIGKALDKLDLDREIERARYQIQSGRKTHRDEAIRKLGYLKSAKKLGIHPREWMLSKVPVLPTQFRPVSTMSDKKLPLVDDANFLYKELIDANDNLREMSSLVDDTGEERLAAYNAFKAVIGLGDPVHPKLQEKNVKGILKHVFGTSPKMGVYQRKLLSATVDMVGRGVIIPDPDLDMDQIGLPENRAWDVYRNFVARRLKRRGMPLTQALKHIEDRSPLAKEELLKEMAVRPVIANRAPVLHKFGMMAFYPRLTKGHTLKINPFVVKGFGADFDGDSCIGSTICHLTVADHLLYNPSVRWGDASTDGDFDMLLKNELVQVWRQNSQSTLVQLPISKFPRGELLETTARGVERYSVPDGILVLSYNASTGTAGFFKVTEFSVHPDLAGYQVQVGRSHEVGVSEDHSLYCYDPETGKLDRSRPEESLGKLCPIVRKIEQQPQLIQDVLRTEDIGMSSPAAGPETKRHLPTPCISADFNFGWWLGACVSDAWTDMPLRGIGHYAKAVPELRRKFRKISNSFLSTSRDSVGLARTTMHDLETNQIEGESTYVNLYASCLVKFIHRWIEGRPKGATTKHLPGFFVSLPYRCKLGIFCGLLDGDGTVDVQSAKSKKTLTFNCKFTTSSRRLKNDILLLAKFLGVKSTVTEDRRALEGTASLAKSISYIICFSKPDILRLRQKMRLSHPEKQSVLQAQPEDCADPLDLVPVDKSLFRQLRTSGGTKDKGRYMRLSEGLRRGYLTREQANLLLHEAECLVTTSNKARWICWTALVADVSVYWAPVTEINPIPRQTMYDLTLPDTAVFAVNNGLIIYDTMQYHVPVDDDAAKEALEMMLPSRNLFSPADFKSVVHGPSQEYTGGLYTATKKSSGRQPRVFANVQSAIAAYRRGEIEVDDPVEILQ